MTEENVVELDRILRIFHRVENGIRVGFNATHWRPVITWLEERHLRNFEQEVDPEGTPWEPLSRFTIAQKGHAQKLIETSELVESLVNSSAQSAVRTVQNHNLVYGTTREWSFVHQEGSANVPARPFIGLNEADVDQAVELIADQMMEMLDDLIGP